MTKMMISARVDERLNDKLEVLAAASRRSKAFLITEALEDYVAQRDWMQSRVDNAIKDLDETGALISNEAVMAWLESLTTDAPLPQPKPDVFRKPKT